MAELLLAQGDPEGARDMYERLLKLEPGKESHRARWLELGGEGEDMPRATVESEPDPQVLEALLEGLT